MVALNRAIAIAELRGAEVGLAALEENPLPMYAYFHSTRADLLERLGRTAEARESFKEATRLSQNQVERSFLQQQILRLKTQ